MLDKKILFRAHSVGHLMTNPNGKPDKTGLSVGAKTYVRECWLRDTYGYSEPLVTPEILKGLLCEQDSIGLIQRIIPVNEFRIKNKQRFENDYFSGLPDIVLNSVGIVEDAKTCWTLKTFSNVDLSKIHKAQGHAYMDLTGLKKCRFIYTLVNTPEILVVNEQQRFYHKFNGDTENPYYVECVEKIKRMHKVDHIPEKYRVKIFDVPLDENYLNELKRRVDLARDYYKSLTL